MGLLIRIDYAEIQKGKLRVFYSSYNMQGQIQGGSKGFMDPLPFERASLTQDTLIEQSQYS